MKPFAPKHVEAESLRSRPRHRDAAWASGGGAPRELEREGGSTRYAERNGAKASGVGVGPHAIRKKSWNRDEWDVALSDGTVYRLFRDCSTDAWFIDAIVD